MFQFNVPQCTNFLVNLIQNVTLVYTPTLQNKFQQLYQVKSDNLNFLEYEWKFDTKLDTSALTTVTHMDILFNLIQISLTVAFFQCSLVN